MLAMWGFLFFLLMHGLGFLAIMMIEGQTLLISTALTQALTPSGITVTVASTDGFLGSDFILVNNEIICYTSTTPTTFTGLTRGASRSLCLSGVSSARHAVTQTHPAGSRVYAENAGMLNQLVGYRVTTKVDGGGNLIESTKLIVGVTGAFASAFPTMIAWNYPIFDGDFLGFPLVYLQVILILLSAAVLVIPLAIEFLRIAF